MRPWERIGLASLYLVTASACSFPSELSDPTGTMFKCDGGQKCPDGQVCNGTFCEDDDSTEEAPESVACPGGKVTELGSALLTRGAWEVEGSADCISFEGEKVHFAPSGGSCRARTRDAYSFDGRVSIQVVRPAIGAAQPGFGISFDEDASSLVAVRTRDSDGDHGVAAVSRAAHGKRDVVSRVPYNSADHWLESEHWAFRPDDDGRYLVWETYGASTGWVARATEIAAPTGCIRLAFDVIAASEADEAEALLFGNLNAAR